jgi:hypothetical protein
MKKQVMLIGIGALALAAAAFAGDIWKEKPYETWDQKEVQKILFDSPWAQQIQMGGGGGPSTGGGGGARGGSGGGGANSVGNSPNGDTAGAGNSAGVTSAAGGRTVGGSEQSSYPRSDKDVTGGDIGSGRPMGGPQNFVVRWVSSRTIREAFARSAELAGKPSEQLTKAVATPPAKYQIILFAPDLRAFQAAGADALKQTVYLETKKNHEKILPDKITLGTAAGGQRVIYVLAEFPRSTDKGEPTLASDEKSVEFVAEAGKLKLKFHFELSKMTDKEGADL